MKVLELKHTIALHHPDESDLGVDDYCLEHLS